ncbi:K+-transporting ATPase ATPase A chain [Sphingomonas vulcanisoli]|uniref:Potassium-transporting ATPase potassium-binding subunit n=1 Tax=Sphingomonas vulcanisoli TaxID=1658060 RepID=A0ABX0TSN2_9SPHN|nr:potassium-transporting ATPase subunit KdpA [Sphingomonas vulcanisoli]NIJ08529.1 K+-transporting ATPase ATPase A chain [Sphingomonas vulcanisoli]
MTIQGWLLIAVFTGLVIAITKPFGLGLYAVMEGRRTWLHPVLGPVERAFYALSGIDPDKEQSWIRFGIHMLLFNVAGLFLTYAILRLQYYLPLNPLGFAGLAPHLAWNTAVSFTTNTNWQSYSGESTMSQFSQMVGLTIHNFISAATGIALAFAFIRGFARRETAVLGNFWADVTRVTLYLLLPVCLVYAVILLAAGVPQTFNGSVVATTLEGAKQTLVLGPVASQEAIKMVGTNGGGIYNGNSAHPYENPSALINLLQMVSIFSFGAGLTWAFGKAVGNTKQGWAIFSAMLALFLVGTAVAYSAESAGNPIHHALGVPGGNMEGKEVRFGIAASSLFAVVTTDASCGAVNAMHDSFTAIGGMIPLFNIQLGEIIFGGVGSGLYGMLLFVILGVFVAGLMVGRTPEYVGKKIDGREVKLAVLAIAVLPLIILGFTGLAAISKDGLAGLANQGPHGFSEMLYAFTSAVGNNGSAFAGLTASTPFYDGLLGVAMWLGRFFVIVPMLAIAGSLGAKRIVPESAGSFPTTGPLWVALLIGVILILGGLTFLPSLALGPIAEHIAMIHGQQF